MARGFGSTLGAGTTDAISSAFSTLVSTPRSIGIWIYINGLGGGSLGRIFDAGPGADLCFIAGLSPAGFINYQRGHSTTAGNWLVATPSSSAWHHLLITYDGGSTSNDPLIYVDGTQGAVDSVTPIGTINTTGAAYYIGNRSTGSRAWDGMLAEFAIWDAILTQDEATSLAKGYSPLFIRPQSLVEYLPMIRDVGSRKVGPSTIVAGTAVQPHPRIIYPSSLQVPFKRSRAVVPVFYHHLQQQGIA